MRYFAIAGCVLVTACSSSLSIDFGAESVSCSEAEPACPVGSICDFTAGRCEPGEVPPRAPTLSAQLISDGSRPASRIELDLGLVDLNGDDVEVEIAYVVRTPASASGEEPTTRTGTAFVGPLAAPPEGATVRAAVVLPEVFDALPSSMVDTVGDGVHDTAIILGRHLLELELTPVDQTGLRGETRRLTPFEIGNSPPSVSLALAGGDIVAEGSFPVEARLVDAEEDLAGLVLEFQTVADDGTLGPWRPMTLLLGSTNALPTSAASDAPSSAVVIWDSRADLQGVNTEVNVRARVFDRAGVGGSERYFGARFVQSFIVVNQLAPEVLDLAAPRSELSGGASVVPVSFLLADEESDLVDVKVQFDLNGREQWADATEYRIPQSEGRFDLATAPADDGGVRHVFYWNPAADVLAPEDTIGSVSLRVLATDGLSGAFGTAEVTSTGVGLFQAPAPSQSAYATTESPFALEDCGDLVPFDHDGDDDPDALLICAFDLLQLELDPSTETWTEVASLASAPGLPTWGAAGDFDGDDDEDIAVYADGVVYWLENDGGASLAPPVVARALAEAARSPGAVVDWNADGADDLILSVLASGGGPDTPDDLRLLEGDAIAPFGAARTLASDLQVSSIAATDWDEDGARELLVTGVDGLDEETRPWDVYLYDAIAPALGAPVPLGVRAQQTARLEALFVRDVQGDPRPELFLTDPSRARAIYAVQTPTGLETLRFNVLNPVTITAFPAFDADRVEVFVQRDDGAVLRTGISRTPNGFERTASAPLGIPCFDTNYERGLVVFELFGLPSLATLDQCVTEPGVVETVVRTASQPFGFFEETALVGLESEFVEDSFERAFLVDFDLDGVLDLIVEPVAPEALPVEERGLWVPGETLYGAGTGRFLYDDAVDVLPEALLGLELIEDLDGDGVEDFVGVGTPADGRFAYALRSPQAPLVLEPVALTYSGPPLRAVRAGDFDGDGERDLLAYFRALGSDPELRIYWGESTSAPRYDSSRVLVFSPAPPVEPTGIAVTDLDEDGAEEILLAGGSFVRLTTSGGRAGLTGQTVTASAPYTSIFAADLDHDGDRDLFASDASQVVWFENQDGTLAEQSPLDDLPTGFVTGFSADFSGDGRRDVLLLSNQLINNVGGYALRWDTGANKPAIAAALERFSGLSVAGVGDLNGDGLADVFTTGFRSAQSYLGLSDRAALSFPLDDAFYFLGDQGDGFVDRFGDVVARPSISISPYGTEPFAGSLDLIHIAEDAGVLPRGATPLTEPWRYAGQQRWVREVGPGGAERIRLQVRPDVPADPAITDPTALESFSVDAGDVLRGFFVELIFAGVPTGELVVVHWEVDWVRDPAESSALLGGAGGSAAVVPRYRPRAILPDPDFDFSTGTGPRFVVVADPRFSFAEIATERLGVFQLFELP